MRKEYDFSKAKRGKFYHADQQLHLPLYLEEDVLAYFEKCAQGKGIELNTLINDLLRKDIALVEGLR